MAGLDGDDIHALEQMRQRLQQLHNSLISLQNHIAQSDPLPPWSSLQSQFSIISNNLQSVSKQLSLYQNLYGSAVAFPLLQFPGRTQEILLQQLLRTRLEPGVEAWMEQGQTVAEDVLHSDDLGKPDVDLQELWEWAPGAANSQARRQHWGADYSRAEVESGVDNVISGLKRKLSVPEEGESSGDEEDEEDDEDEDDDGGEGAKKKDVEMTNTAPAPKMAPLAMESIFRFTMTGTLPPGASSG